MQTINGGTSSDRWSEGRFSLDGNHIYVMGTFSSGALQTPINSGVNTYSVLYKINLMYL